MTRSKSVANPVALGLFAVVALGFVVAVSNDAARKDHPAPMAAKETAIAPAPPPAATGQKDAGSSLSDAERKAFRAEVRAYLLDNPEVLMEAIAVLEKRQAAQEAMQDEQLVAVNAQDIFNDGYSWEGGNPQGDITLVEFTDYRCTYCRKAHDEVSELVKSDGNIRLVVKEFPILGEQSELSSRFAIATLQVAGPEAYKRAHDALITFRGKVTIANLEKLAERLDLDAGEILERMTDARVELVIQENRALAQRLDISGTPTFIVDDGQMLRGYLPLQGMRQVIADARSH